MPETVTAQRAPAEAPEEIKSLPARKPSLVAKFAHKYSIDAEKLMGILKQTAFKQKNGEATNEQMAALLVVADQYGLNPFTREIYAFPDKQNGIVPVVGVDGWARMINDHWAANGFEFREPDDDQVKIDEDAQYCPEWMEVIIHRKDRDHPVVVREYLEEVYRPVGKYDDGNKKKPGPWQSHTKRMLRHKTLIQGARLAFGFTGIYDADEAERIVEGQVIEHPTAAAEPQRGAAALKTALLAGGDAGGKQQGTVEQRDAFCNKFGQCADVEALDLQLDQTRNHAWTDPDQAVITDAYTAARKKLLGE